MDGRVSTGGEASQRGYSPACGDEEPAVKPFPATAAYTGYDAPVRIEADIRDLEVIGTLPSPLEGSWYRCGPDTQYPPMLGQDIYINGDGMISMFRFQNGHVDFKCRYVQTERWKAERAARRSLYGKYRNRWTDAPDVEGRSRGTANTTPLWHGGRLLVLKEDTVPIQVDPDTLATMGDFTWNGALRSKTVTAHPKIDPVNGECVLMGYECEGDGSSAMAYFVENADGSLATEQWFEPPYVSMVHDFAITQDYVVFPIMPTTMDPDRLRSGGDHWMWDGSRPSWMGIMSRAHGANRLRWCKMPTVFAFHTINAFNEGRLVHVDMVASTRNAFPFIADITGADIDPRAGIPFATRWTFDLDNPAEDGGFLSRRLSEIPGELPIIDPRRVGLKHRFAYIAMTDPSHRMLKAGPAMMAANAIGKIDLERGPPQFWHGAPENSFQEGVFIPRGPGEDEGWYINVADYHDQNRSELLVFDAQHIDAGPVATARVPFRLRNAFHTTWVPTA